MKDITKFSEIFEAVTEEVNEGAATQLGEDWWEIDRKAMGSKEAKLVYDFVKASGSTVEKMSIMGDAVILNFKKGKVVIKSDKITIKPL